MGLSQSMLNVSGTLGFLIANLLCVLLSVLMTPTAYDSYGWRLPFLAVRRA